MYKLTIFALVATAFFCLAAAAPQNPFWPDQKCKEGEVKMNCGPRCENKCNMERPSFCNGGIICDPPTCGCRKNLARNTVTGECVQPSECPKK